MLILTRKPLQTVIIGKDIEVTVLDIKGGRVRFGVTAPREVKVLRKELPPFTSTATPEAEPNPGLARQPSPS